MHLLADRPEFALHVGKACFDTWPDIAINDFGINNVEEFT